MRRIALAAFLLILTGNVWAADTKPLARKLGRATRSVADETAAAAGKVGAAVKKEAPVVGRAVVKGADKTLKFAEEKAPEVRRSAKSFAQWCWDSVVEFWRGFTKK